MNFKMILDQNPYYEIADIYLQLGSVQSACTAEDVAVSSEPEPGTLKPTLRLDTANSYCLVRN